MAMLMSELLDVAFFFLLFFFSCCMPTHVAQNSDDIRSTQCMICLILPDYYVKRRGWSGLVVQENLPSSAASGRESLTFLNLPSCPQKLGTFSV